VRVRVVVLDAEGTSFSRGVDPAWMQRAGTASPASNEADAQRFAAMLQSVAECPKPVIACVSGDAFGAGLGLCCASDLVLAAPQARFALDQVRRGWVPAMVGPHVIQAVGRREAQRLALTAAPIDAHRAERIGLVTEVVSDAAMPEVLERIVAELLSNGPCALAWTKRLYATLPVDATDGRGQQMAVRALARMRASTEALEGCAAALERRAPAWSSEAPVPDWIEPGAAAASDSGFGALDFELPLDPIQLPAISAVRPT